MGVFPQEMEFAICYSRLGADYGAYFKDSVVSRGDAGGLGELDALSMAHAAAPG